MENYAGVPGTFVHAENELGHESILVTLFPSRRQYDDGSICLNMPFVGTSFINFAKKIIGNKEQLQVSNKRRKNGPAMPLRNPDSTLLKHLFRWRDTIWEPKIHRLLSDIRIDTFDLIYLDGGMGFLRSGKIITQLKDSGIRVGIIYYGSDLRTRGVIAHVDALAEHRFTLEFDHTILYPATDFVFFPFSLATFQPAEGYDSNRIRIGHAPTNRQAKGTTVILRELDDLKKTYPLDIVLIENLPHSEALTLKSSCDIFIDNIGELGYGINSLESLAMGIPTAVELLPDFVEVLGDHPFITISEGSIARALLPYLKSEHARKALGEKGRNWVNEKHDPLKIAAYMLDFFT